MASACVKIEKGVPLAVISRNSAGAPVKYPFRDMEVGDSFVAPLSQTKCKSLEVLRHSLRVCARETIGPSKIATRKLPDGSGFRVWRIA